MDLLDWWVEMQGWLQRVAASDGDAWAVIVVIAGLVVVLALWLIVLARRRLRSVAVAINDSTRSKYVPTQQRVGLLRGDILPAPDPFSACTVELVLRGPFGVLPTIGSQRIIVSGHFESRPVVELVWQRGRAPERALGRGPDTRLWVSRRLDFVAGEYAVRGVNPTALEHAFLDLQTRFGAFVRSVRILADAYPHFDVELEGNGLSPEDIPALITTLRALARTAVRA